MFKSLSICLFLCLSANLYAISFQGIGDLPGGHVRSDVWGMSSDAKTIVGASSSANGQEAFRWTAEEGIVPLGDLSGGQFQSIAMSVSNDGAVIAGLGSTAPFGSRAFQYTQNNGIVELPSLGTINNQPYNFYTIAEGISADGSVIIGKANYTNAQLGGPSQGDRACYWVNDQMHLLTPPGYDSFSGTQAEAISADGSTILIRTNYNNGYLWSESSGFQALPSDPRGLIFLMSDNASVLGGYDPGARTSFLWSEDDGLTQIELPDDWFENKIGCLNKNGSMAGGSLWAEEYYSAFDPQYLEAYLWDEINGIRFVEDILTGYGINLNGWALTNISGISADGTIICGNGVNPDGLEEAWIATIPEPATILLTLSGALIAFRRKS